MFGSFTLVIVLNFLKSKAFSKRPLNLEFQGLTYCSIFDFQGPCAADLSATAYTVYHAVPDLSTTFLFFSVSFGKKRRKRDLNPRAGCPTYTLSRGASSAS